ncbi:hypothetical protein AAFF_G00012820 [Aldrovandia affinis]|uniref:Uncharacterized protein n=1 Tax=Aldrovandia affinis TaxID=143900 RepID=A0AAD7WI69_9TELE|nr:hypothetical protein AAFF_G00012820 [Aldrovandia affinis]
MRPPLQSAGPLFVRGIGEITNDDDECKRAISISDNGLEWAVEWSRVARRRTVTSIYGIQFGGGGGVSRNTAAPTINQSIRVCQIVYRCAGMTINQNEEQRQRCFFSGGGGCK